MFRTDKFIKAATLGVALLAASMSASAQVVPTATAATPEGQSLDAKIPATIGEITDLSRQIRVELLKKELREARGEETKVAAPEPEKAVPFVPPLPPVKVIPPAPSVLAIYGQAGQPLKVRLSGGSELGMGETYGEWRITAVNAAGATFERCEKVKSGRKTENECVTRFVSPRG